MLPLTSDATLYAGWQGQTVGYHVSYWLEKPNIVPDDYPAPVWTSAGEAPPAWGPSDGALSATQLADPANFDFLEDQTASATAGTTVSGPTSKTAIPTSVQELVRAQLDPARVQTDPLTFADLVPSGPGLTVKGDGSTVVNVYLTRALWRNDFPLIAPGPPVTTTRRCSTTTSYDITLNVYGHRYYQTATPVPGDGTGLGTFSVRTKIGLNMQALAVAPVPLSQADGSVQIPAYDAGTQNQSCVLRGWGPQQVTPNIFQASYTGGNADAAGVDLGARTTSMTAYWAARSTQYLTHGIYYVEAEDQSQAAPDEVIGPDGAPRDPIHVTTLYNNDKTTHRVDIPAGQQIFEQLARPWWYWAGPGDRQIAGVIEGFTSWVDYGTGPILGNGFQLDQPLNRFYQLKNSGNTNDFYRYLFYSRNAYNLVFITSGGTAIAPVNGIRYQSSLAPYAPPDPTRGNDEFQGWYTDSSHRTPFTLDGATMPASNLVLYAKWLVDPHDVDFYDDPSSTVPLPHYHQDVEDQGEAAMPKPLPPRPDGSTFLGWYQRTDAGYFVPYDFDTPVGSDLRLYARWQQPASSPYDVTYDGNGNTGGTVPVDGWSYNAGASAIVADGSSLVRRGEVFVGWRLRLTPARARIVGATAGPVEGLYQAGHTVPVGGSDVTLVAVYADPHPSYAVTFHENGVPDRRGAWDGVPGASITYPAAHDVGFTGPGAPRRFLGWSTDRSATRPDPAYDRLVVAKLTGDLALYAVWTGEPTPPTPAPEHGSGPPSGLEGPGGDLPGTGFDALGPLALGLGLLCLGAIVTKLGLRRDRGDRRA